jgi:hypothetical protein
VSATTTVRPLPHQRATTVARDRKVEARTAALLEEQDLKRRLQEARKRRDALAVSLKAASTQALGTVHLA